MNPRKLTMGAVLAMLILAGPVRAGEVVLTEELVTRYEKTFPEMWSVTKKLDEVGKTRESDEKNTKTSLLIAKREKILQAHGWVDLWEYMDVMNRLTPAYVAVSVLNRFANRPENDPDRLKVEDEARRQMEEKGYSAEEIKLVTKHLPVLRKIREEAGI